MQSIKVLLDPIITNDPQFCVMNFKMREIVQHLLAVRDDVFFYWIVPCETRGGREQWDVDWNWFPQSDRIKFFEIPTYRDRMKEYKRLSQEMLELLHHKGACWDADVILTSRTPLIHFIRQNTFRINARGFKVRRVLVLDDMPIMNFKRFVAGMDPAYQDLQTLAGYYAADRSFFINFWERDQVLKEAKQWLAPSRVREMGDRCIYSHPITVPETFQVKRKQDLTAIHTHEKQFTVAYTQRIEKAHRRTDEIFEIMRRQWVYRGGRYPMRFVVTSNTRGFTTPDDLKDVLEFYRAPREEFWRMVREEMAVILVLAQEDGYSYSVMEPLMLGTPVIIQRAYWSEQMLGKDYPFFVAGEQQAYGMIVAFWKDYITQYRKFVQWQQSAFRSILETRDQWWLPRQVEAELQLVDAALKQWWGKKKGDWNSVTQTYLDAAEDEVILPELHKRLQKEGKIRSSLHIDYDDTRPDRRVSFDYSEPYLYRMEMLGEGYVDASVQLGHLRKVAV